MSLMKITASACSTTTRTSSESNSIRMKKATETIKVAFRLRPLNNVEKQEGRSVCCVANEDEGVVEINHDGQKKRFTFDSVFGASASQRHIYDVSAAPVVQSVLEGFNGTMFVYGQTGAGKTHTMEGSIIPNTFEHIFDHIALNSANERYLVHASFFEIYNEDIRDLLVHKSKKSSLELRESDAGVYVKGLTSKVVTSVSEIDAVLQDGKKNRSVGSTRMNSQSSRSHSIFNIVVECCTTDEHSNERIRVGKLNLVDLAGSERQSKTGATGERLKEATKINLSLSALGNVISALVDGKGKHIPYRDSKLTRILQDSLGGNTKTVMLANAGPADINVDESLSTLRYANRAKNIKNIPKVNEDPKDALLRGYQEEIARLKERLSEMSSPKAANIDNSVVVQALPKLDEEQQVHSSMRHDKSVSLQKKLEEEQAARLSIENERRELQQNLVEMEARLMVGGENASNVAKQEAALRKANQELIAKRERELLLTRKMNEQEEEKLDLEERYNDIASEVNHKTKKLKKIWARWQQTKAELKDLEQETQVEKTELLESIRILHKQLKLKELVISNFIPPQYALLFDDVEQGGRAVWDDAEETWIIPGLNLHGHARLRERGASCETEFSREMRTVDSNPRWRCEDVVDLELDMPALKPPSGRDDPNTIDAVAAILALTIDDDEDENVSPSAMQLNRQNKYLKAGSSSKQKQKRRKHKTSSRPTTAL